MVTYTNGNLSKQATITVEAETVDQTALEVKDSTIKQGSSWQPSDNLVNALDADGTDVREAVANSAQGSVDTSKPGKYVVTYTNGNLSKQATIIVEGKQVTVVPDIGGNILKDPTDSPDNSSLNWPVELGTTGLGETSWLLLEPTDTGEFSLDSPEETDLTRSAIAPMEEMEWEGELFPQTGEQKNNCLIGLGSILILLGLSGLFLRNHSKR